MADIDNVKLGVCSVKFNGVDLGHTKGGVEVTYTPEYHDKTVDYYGNTVVGKYLIGEKFTAKVPLAEYTLANLKVAIPGGDNSPAGKLTIGKQSGTDLAVSEAALLVLHPIANASNDLSEDVVMYKALVTSEVVIPHMFDSEKVVEVTFEAILDESKSEGNYLGLIGDSTAS